MTGLPAPDAPTGLQLWRTRLADLRGRGAYAGYPDRHRCIFIHVPKVAGTSIARALFGAPSRHLTYRDYLHTNPGKFRRYFKFAFVRDPWDRVVSTYHFLNDGGLIALDRQWSDANLRHYRGFEHFVREGLERPEIRSWVHFRPQAEFICTPDNVSTMDFVGRYENLDRDFAHVAGRLGIAADLPASNASDHAPFAACYTRETARIVERVYASDIDAFGYAPPV